MSKARNVTKRLGQPPKPEHLRRRMTTIRLAPFHHYIIHKLREGGQIGTKPHTVVNGHGEAFTQLLEKAAQEQGITEAEFLALPEEEQKKYFIGYKT